MEHLHERPPVIYPEQKPVELTRGERLLYHADKLANEIKAALDDGQITVWEGVKIGLSVIAAAFHVIKGKP